jgi:hypothetical protein
MYMYAMDIQNDVICLVLRENCKSKQVTDYCMADQMSRHDIAFYFSIILKSVFFCRAWVHALCGQDSNTGTVLVLQILKDIWHIGNPGIGLRGTQMWSVLNQLMGSQPSPVVGNPRLFMLQLLFTDHLWVNWQRNSCSHVHVVILKRLVFFYGKALFNEEWIVAQTLLYHPNIKPLVLYFKTLVSSTNKIDCHNITEILLNVAF